MTLTAMLSRHTPPLMYEELYQSVSLSKELKPESQRNRKGFSHLSVAPFPM